MVFPFLLNLLLLLFCEWWRYFIAACIVGEQQRLLLPCPLGWRFFRRWWRGIISFLLEWGFALFGKPLFHGVAAFLAGIAPSLAYISLFHHVSGIVHALVV